MKKIVLMILCCWGMVYANAQHKDAKTGNVNISYLNPFNSQGCPVNLAPDRVFELPIFADIDSALPERVPMAYIDPTITTDLQLIEETDVWMSIILEKAKGTHSIGFYTYDLCNPPKSVSDIKIHQIVFPNASLTGDGGGLVSGNTVKLGHFKANTGIGWFVIYKGWGAYKIESKRQIVYANSTLNNNGFANKNFMVFLNDKNRSQFILGIEDFTDESDFDMNDILVSIELSNFSAVNIEKSASLGGYEQNVSIENTTDNELNPDLEVEVITEVEYEEVEVDEIGLFSEEVDSIVEEDVVEKIEDELNDIDDKEAVINSSPICEDNGMKFTEVQSLYATLLTQTNDGTRTIVIQQKVAGKMLTSDQVLKLLSSFDSESDILEMAKDLYDQTCDTENFATIAAAFKSQANISKLQAFMEEKNPESVSDFEEVYTEAVSENIGPCGLNGMDEKQIKKVSNRIRSMSFGREKLMVLEQDIDGKCLYIDQVISLLDLFSNEFDRVEAAKFLFDYLHDKSTFPQVYPKFEYDSSLEELKGLQQ